MQHVELSAEEEIRNVLHTQLAALRDKDAARLLETYTDDVVHFSLAPPLQTAGPAARSAPELIDWFETWDGPIVETITHLACHVADVEGLAFCHGLVNMTGTKVPHGQDKGGPVDLWFRATWGLRRGHDGWKVAHEHSSTPFLMDGSGLAALELRPEGPE